MRVKYDAILFSFDKKYLMPVYFCDGQYKHLFSLTTIRFLDENFYPEFKKTIKDII